MFSTPEEGGSLTSQGGWLLFIMDTCGVWMFGNGWSLATSGAVSACERDVGESGQEKALLIISSRRPGFKALTLTGPSGVRAVDTEFYNEGVRGRGINRKPHDLIVVLDTGVARLQVDQERRGRIDRHGLWVQYSRVLGVSTRSVREQLERKQAVHLCKAADCQGGEGLHCTSYDAVDAEALVDIGAYGKVSAWRLGVLALRGLYSLTGVFTALCRSCRCRCRPQRLSSAQALPQIHHQGVLRSLDPDSESETEAVLDACDAVRVGIALQGKQHALSSEECQDRSAPESTRLLEEDRALSDLAGSETARLCSHHSQLYMLSCQGRKCSVVSCYASAKGAHRGAPFCKRHLAETVRSPSPARKPKAADTALASALRLQSQHGGADDTAPSLGDDVPTKRPSR